MYNIQLSSTSFNHPLRYVSKRFWPAIPRWVDSMGLVSSFYSFAVMSSRVACPVIHDTHRINGCGDIQILIPSPHDKYTYMCFYTSSSLTNKVHFCISFVMYRETISFLLHTRIVCYFLLFSYVKVICSY